MFTGYTLRGIKETIEIKFDIETKSGTMLPDNISVISFGSDNSVMFSHARSIREEVFIREQKVPEELEYENDESAVHYLLLKGDVPIATGRWRKTEGGIKLERFAVPYKHRGKGYGTILLQKVLEDVIPKQKKIYLHSQVTAVNYYLRADFICEGDKFYEAGIAHYLMVFRRQNSNA